ncbi:MAG: hypothetical protein JXA18_00460 [Chitinispirillaceae bacterium]|nr:hypothetical protein [Chitinispirillaceae bacterium]
MKPRHAEFLLLVSVGVISYIVDGSLAATVAAESPDYYYPNPDISTNGIVRAVLFYGGTLYVGGNFTRVTDKNGTHNRTDLAAYDTTTGRVTGFRANTNTGLVRAIVAGNGKLFVGGSFTRINGESCSKVAALDPTSGAVLTEFRNNEGTIDGTVQALAVSDTALYIGGNFSTVDGYPRSYLAALDADNGVLDQQFDPSPSDPFDDSGKTPGGIYALEMHPDNPRIVFAGGNFLTVAGMTNQPYLIALHSDGTPGPVFQGLGSLHYPVMDLDAHGSFCYAGIGGWGNRVMSFRIDSVPYTRQWRSVWVNGDVQAIAYARQGYVYFGCHDGVLDSMDNFRLAVLNATTGTIYDIYPPMNSFFGVRALDITDNCLAAGGEFTRMNEITQRYLALFTKFPFSFDSILPPAVPTLVYPPDSMTGIYVVPTMRWNFAPYAATYELQVAEDPEFSNLIVSSSGLTEYRQRCSGLENNTEYWWRVRAHNAAGVSDWSMIRFFITMPGRGDIPVPSSPANWAISQPLELDLSWYCSASARSYRLQFSASYDFADTMIDREGIIDTSFNVSGLAHTTEYYWRVDALTAGGETDWSDTWKFTTLPGQEDIPALAAPADQTISQPIELDLMWYRSVSARSYRVQLSESSDFADTMIDWEGIIDTSLNVSGLAYTTAYYWRVDALTAGGETDWSAIRKFTTLPGNNDIPALASPADGAANQPVAFDFTWHPSRAALSYCLQLSMVSDEAKSILDISDIFDTSFAVSGLVNNTVYYWRVNAQTAGGATGWASARFQTIVAAPTSLQCTVPADNASQLILQPMLQWRSVVDAAVYRVQVSTDSAFAATICDTSGLTDTSFVLSGLAEDTRYFWRVNCSNIAGEAWSPVMRFTTIYPLPFTPIPVAPAPGCVARADSLRLVWHKSEPHVTKYWIEIAHDTAMSDPFVDSMVADTEFIRRQLDDKKEFWWRVRSYNETGWSAFSETRYFRTLFPPYWEQRFSLDKFAFSGRYASIVYSLAEACDVRIELFDLRGKSLRTIILEQQSPGLYREHLPSLPFSVGTYLLSFRAGHFAKTAVATLVR